MMIYAREAAQILGVSPARVAQLTSEVTFPEGRREGLYVLYDRDEVIRWAIQCGRIHAAEDGYEDPWWGQGHDLQVAGILRNRQGHLVHIYADGDDRVPLVTIIRERLGTYAESIKEEAVEYAQRAHIDVSNIDYVACVEDTGDRAKITVVRTSDGLVFPVSPKKFRRATSQPVVVEDAGLDADLVKLSHLTGKTWTLHPGWDGNIDVLMDAAGLTEVERKTVLHQGSRCGSGDRYSPRAGENLAKDPDVKVVSTFYPYTRKGDTPMHEIRRGISQLASREINPQTLEIAKFMVSNVAYEDRLSPDQDLGLAAYLVYKCEEISNHIQWTWEPSEPRVGHLLAGADWLVGRDLRKVQGFWVLNGGEGGYAVLYGHEGEAPSVSLVLPKDVQVDERFSVVPALADTNPEGTMFLLGLGGIIKAVRS